MKLLFTIIFFTLSNLLFAQDTLKNNFPTYFISQIELRYELIDLENTQLHPLHTGKHKILSNLHQPIKPFSPDEFPPYFNLELSEKDIFEFQSGFEIEFMEYFMVTENNHLELVADKSFSNSSWIISTNFDNNESVNFYNFWESQNTSIFKNQVTLFSLFYQKEKFLRSVFDGNFNLASRKLYLNFSYFNKQFYQHESNTAIGNGNRRYVFFPKKYHEQKMSDWVHSFPVQNQNMSGSSIFANLLLSPFNKTYLKIESELHWLFLSNEKQLNQRFASLGVGTKPIDGTIIFLEYTNRNIGFNQFPGFSTLEEKPYFSLSANRILKLKLFKR